jgi:hypothetical protein
MSACGTSYDAAITWLRVALFTSRPRLYSGTWECCGCAMSTWGRVREPLVKSVGKPDSRNGHVRFDERGRDTVGRPSLAARYRALPRFYAVAAHTPACMQDKCDVRLGKKESFAPQYHRRLSAKRRHALAPVLMIGNETHFSGNDRTPNQPPLFALACSDAPLQTAVRLRTLRYLGR